MLRKSFDSVQIWAQMFCHKPLLASGFPLTTAPSLSFPHCCCFLGFCFFLYILLTALCCLTKGVPQRLVIQANILSRRRQSNGCKPLDLGHCQRNNITNLAPVGPILAIVVLEWMCRVRFQISRVRTKTSPRRESNDVTVGGVSEIIPLLLVVLMKNLFGPAEYRVYCLWEGVSCQISVSQMIMDGNLSMSEWISWFC